MKLNELQDFLSGCIDLGFTFPLNPKWILCDSGWKALWNKLTGSNHPNVQLSINAWYPPGSGLKERIEEIHQQYPRGFESDHSGRKKGTQAWDEAELALERYKRIQRAKRKLRCFLCFISFLQQSQKKVQARYALAESSKVGEGNEGSSNRMGEDSLIEEKPTHRAVIWSIATPKECNADAINPPTDDAIAKIGDRNNTVVPIRAKSEDLLTKLDFRRHRRQSSVEDENIDIIDSILMSDVSLSDYQKDGLRRIREQQVNPLRINHRFERRHTSFHGRSCISLGEVPAFILNEYGGLKGDAPIFLKNQVKKIIHAQRLIGHKNGYVQWPSCGNEHFLPVEWTTLNPESKQRLADKLSFDALSRWDFNMIDFSKLSNGSPLLFIGWAIMGSPHSQQAMAIDLGRDSRIETNGYNFITQFSIHMPILCAFFRTVETDYIANPYHNSTHAADVVQTLNTMLQLGGKEYASSPLDLFSILVAAVIHDVGHPGLSNNFQINTHSELAVQFNDVSVLENNSIAWLFKKLLGENRDFTIDIFNGLTGGQFSKMRSLVIRSVLETDMTHHFALLTRMLVHQEAFRGKEPEEWFQSYTNEGVKFDPWIDMLCFLLHQADISNPAKPYPLFTFWTEHILAEYFAQGDKEASLSLPKSPLCDRLTTDKKQSQIAFIKFVVQPSYIVLGDLIPRFAKTVSPHIARSLEYWEDYENNDDIEDDTCK